ncbi:MAG: NAD(+)/NADH kinase [Proteobacteria bacterium]|nr:NAD(+)/NADH kinase [Pseudomonadota bacterium]
MNAPFSSIGLIGNVTDTRVAECMLSLVSHLSRRQGRILVDRSVELAFAPGSVTHCEARDFAKEADLIIAIGGDGTLLYASRLVAGHDVPLLGVNRGRLGFLTDVGARTMLEDVDTVLGGRYAEDPRSMLSARLERPGAEPLTALALNDVVLQKRDSGRMLDFQTAIDDNLVNSHGADGLVVASATGSTAYALSCGGPIVQPELDVFVLAPVCPHTLSDRPIIVSARSRISLRLMERPFGRAQVTCDGETLGDMQLQDVLYVEKAQSRITLLHPPGYDYYRVLRSKLHWGRGGHDARSSD